MVELDFITDLANHFQRSIIPVGADKLPLVKWKPYQSRRATIEQIREWNKQFSPTIWGQVTGVISGIVTLDFDGETGKETLQKLELNPHRKTGKGYHVDFNHPGWHVKTENNKSSSKRAWAQAYPGLDIRGDGGYSAIAGMNEKGPYEWLRDPGDLDSLDILPTDLREWLGLLYSPESKVPQRALEKYLAEASYMGRDNACFELACQLRDNNSTRSEAEDYCIQFARRVHTTNQKGDLEPFTESDARAKVASAYSYAKRDPWSGTSTYNPSQEHSSNGNGSKPPEDSKQPDFETIIQRLGENEYGDGLLFAEVFNGLVCYDHSEKAWYLWNKHHWKKDATGKIKRLVSGHLGSIYLKARGDVHKQIVDNQAEIEQLQIVNKEDKKLPKLNERLKYLGDLMEALEKRARALRGANRMKNVLTFAMSEHNIGITGEIWDTDPYLIGVSNGVINLRTGQLRDGYPIDYIRSVSSTEWKGLNEPCPIFERFQQEIFEDKPEDQRQELIGFLQRLFGYAITGLVTEHIFPLFYGEEGRNGKDTLFTLLKYVLGSAIANAISNDVFLSADKGRSAGSATPHLTDLQGKRIVWGSETKQGDRINVSQVKLLTGGGSISARPPYGLQYSFDPTHTLFLMTNYKPHADAKDKPFWSRACLIEFNMRFVDNPQSENERKADTNLSKDLEKEASGILAYLVRGCLEYQKQGLNRPEIVELATESYRASEDNMQQFIDECCVCNEKAYVGAKRLYDTYITWCKDNNLPHIDGKLFGKDITKRFVKVHKRSGWEYQKIGILVDEYLPDGSKCDGSTPLCDGSNEYPSHPSEQAPGEALDTTEIEDCDGCDGLIQESPNQLVRENARTPFYGNTRHTRHTSDVEDTMKQPLEPIDSTVTSQDSPVTDEFHPSQQASLPEDFSFEDTECSQCGCGIFHKRYGSLSCARCNPPKGYHAYSVLVDEMFPVKHNAKFGKA